jgi:4'-phosphopantetheinyl transferase
MLASAEVEVSFARPEELELAGRREAALALLTHEERAHVDRFHFERDRILHLTARALLRRSLSRHADVPPDAWRFRASEYGRPEIASPASPLRFNVSHTAGLAMVAVVVGREVGVDVEKIPGAVPWDVLDSSFAEVERDAVRAAPPEEQAARFAQIWTLKEAYVKARGLGLSLALQSFAFRVQPPQLLFGDDASTWHVQAMSPTPLHRASMCVRSDPGRSLRLIVNWDDE